MILVINTLTSVWIKVYVFYHPGNREIYCSYIPQLKGPFLQFSSSYKGAWKKFPKIFDLVFLQYPGHTRDLESQPAGAPHLMNNASLRPAPTPTDLYWLKGFLEPAEDDDVCVSMKILFYVFASNNDVLGLESWASWRSHVLGAEN